MIVQKEVKFALGLTVIFTLLAAAIFVYEGEKKEKTPDGNTNIAAVNAGQTSTETETKTNPKEVIQENRASEFFIPFCLERTSVVLKYLKRRMPP